jgi:hypothetical protein
VTNLRYQQRQLQGFSALFQIAGDTAAINKPAVQ